ncbi:MAG: hypothetical protein KAG53_09035 [Endozoicomonadaceae bacterium]|nr:hypothetical protein [Endozoicomonadaceae bacterium]
MSNMMILPTIPAYSMQQNLCPAMTSIARSHYVFCNTHHVVITPFIRKKLDSYHEDTETEEMDKYHKIEKVHRKSNACFAFMKQHF